VAPALPISGQRLEPTGFILGLQTDWIQNIVFPTLDSDNDFSNDHVINGAIQFDVSTVASSFRHFRHGVPACEIFRQTSSIERMRPETSGNAGQVEPF